jgi:hypothetical protein
MKRLVVSSSFSVTSVFCSIASFISLISPATTAKPLPASPALAASLPAWTLVI